MILEFDLNFEFFSFHSSVLIASQACGQTPSKINTPSKYNFPSPVKALQAKSQGTLGNTERRSGGRKGVQLFRGESVKTPQEDSSKTRKLSDRMSNPSNQSKSLNLNSVRNQKSARRSLELSDYIVVEKPKQNKKNKKGRRSDPVLQSVAREESCPVVAEKLTIAAKDVEDRSVSYKSSPADVSIEVLAKMTPEMKKQYDNSQMWDSIVSTNFSRRSPDDKIKTQLSSVEDQLVEALPEQVTNKDKINVLVTLYSQCIRMHLVPNILMEIYLLFQLLTIKESKGQLDKPSKQLLLGSVHNCVYFATAVLNDQVTLLVHLDRATLAFLVQNPRLETFSGQLQEKIQEVLSKKKRRRCSSSNPSEEEASLTSVRFQLETDARETFPDTQTFQDSRKQRDMFYDMLRHWSPSTKSDIGPCVIKLLSLQSHPVNLRHFATLFLGQLIASAASLSIAADDSDDLKLLSSLKTKVNSDKLLSRIVTRSQFGGPCPDPTFSGSQEFFKEFIMHSTFGFVTHLKDLLSRSILAKYEISSGDQLEKLDCDKIIIELRILAKFLGFIETLPYQKCQTDSPLANELLEMRKREELPYPTKLDLEKILESSRKNQNLIITIPWIVEYCSMLDPISIKLPYYQSIFKQLINIYKFHLIDKATLNKTSVAKIKSNHDIDNDQFSSSPTKSMSKGRTSLMPQRVTDFNAFFLCIHLGWLFERPSFPRELFISGVSLKEEAKLGGKEELQSSTMMSLDTSETSLKSILLYQCCPFVSELKVILCQFQSGFKAKRGSICADSIGKSKLSKEIMMKTAKATAHNEAPKTDGNASGGKMNTSSKANKSENMQEALVANFFHNQSASIKEAVDTVTKRVSNNFVCKLRNEVIPHHSKMVMQDITANLALLCSSSDCEKIKEELLSQVASMSEKSQTCIQRRGNDIVEEQLGQRVHPSLHCLLPEDTKKPVVDFCGRIIEKRIKDEANEWMKNNLAKELSLLLTNQFEKLWNDHIKALNGTTSVKQTGIVAHMSDESDQEAVPIYEILIRLKNETSLLNSGRKMVPKDRIKNEEAFILSLLGQIQRSFATEFSQAPVEEKGNLDSTVKGLEHLTFDWALTLFIHCPMTMTPEVQQKFIELWGGHDPKMRPLFCLKEAPGSLATLFSPRNLRLLSQSRHLDEAWKKLDFFTGRLLCSGLLLPKVLELQCLELLRKELPNDALRRFGMFLRSVVDSWRKTPIEKSELMDFTEELLDWLPYIFSNMNSEYDDNFPVFQ